MKRSNVKLLQREGALPMRKVLRTSLIRRKREKQVKKAAKADCTPLQTRAAEARAIPVLAGMMTRIQAIQAAQNRVPDVEVILRRIPVAALPRIMRDLDGKIIKIHKIRIY